MNWTGHYLTSQDLDSPSGRLARIDISCARAPAFLLSSTHQWFIAGLVLSSSCWRSRLTQGHLLPIQAFSCPARSAHTHANEDLGVMNSDMSIVRFSTSTHGHASINFEISK